LNRIKLNLSVSENRNLTYLVYRAEKPEDIPASLDRLKDLQPVMEVDEATAATTILTVSEELRTGLSNEEDTMVRYKLKNKCVKSDTVDIELVIHFDLPNLTLQHETDQFVFSYRMDGSLAGVVRTKRNLESEIWGGSNLSDCPVSITGDVVEVPKAYVEGSLFVELAYPIQVIEVQDDVAVQAGVIYNGPIPHGLAAPDVSFKTRSLLVENGSYVPLWEISDAGSEEKGRLYYYRIVAVQGGLVSPASVLFSHELKQKPETVRHILEVCKSYQRSDNPLWEPLTILAKGEVAQIGMPKGAEYSRFGKPVEAGVPEFSDEDWKLDTKYILSEHKVIVTLPNVWCKGDPRFNRRPHVAYRLIAELQGFKSEEGPVLTETEEAHLPVERMIVIRRTVTGLDETEKMRGSLVNEGTVIKTYVRKNGIYYDSIIGRSLPVNVPKSTSPTDTLTEASIFKSLTIEDACLPGESYNYTVYMYDSYGDRSRPITRLVDL